MSTNRYKNIIGIKILLRDEFSDPRILNFIEDNKHTKFSSQYYKDFYWSIHETVTTENAVKLVDFIYNYKGGCLIPYKWSEFEPVNKLVDENTRKEAIISLANPGCSFLFNRKETNCRFQAEIDNKHFAPGFIGVGKKSTYQPPIAPLPKFLLNIRFWFYKSDAKKNGHDMNFFKQLVYDIGSMFDLGEYYIYDEDEFTPAFHGKDIDSIFNNKE